MRNLTRALDAAIARFAEQPAVSWQNGQYQPNETGMRNWLLDGTGYSSVSLDANNNPVVECLDNSWALANASDLIANREASFESLIPRHSAGEHDRALAWPIITAYYAIYFSAQALLRCLGLGSIYLEAGEASQLSLAWNARGFGVPIQANNYGFAIALTNPITITLRPLGGSGGAHKQFWNGFSRLQPDISSVILVSGALNTLNVVTRQVANSEYKRLIEHAFVNTNAPVPTPNFDWLSSFRNEINYRFSEHVWVMNWQHATGITANHERLLARYSIGNRVLPEANRIHSKDHLTFVAAKFTQLIRESTTALSIP